MKRLAAVLTLLTALFAFAGQALADWSYVRSNTAASQTGSATPTLTITAPTSGDILVGNVGIDSGLFLESVTDNQNNAYLVVTGSDNVPTATVATFEFVSKGLINNGPTTLTFHLSGTPSSFGQLIADEFTPPAGTAHISVDGFTAYTFLGGLTGIPNPTVSSTFQNIHSDVLIWGGGFNPGGASTAGSGFTQGASVNNEYSEFQIQSSASIANAISWTSLNGGDLWGVGIGIAPVAATSWQPVQSRHFPITAAAGSGSIWTVSFSLPAPATAGHILVGTVGLESGTQADLVSILDNIGNSYSPLTPNAGAHFLIWSGGLLTTTPQTFTITVNASQQIFAMIDEIAPPPHTTSVQVDGGAPALQDANQQGTSVAGPITTTKNGDLIYGFASFGSTGVATPLDGLNLLGNWGFFNADGYFIQSTAGSASTSFLTNSATGPYPTIQYAFALSATVASGGGGGGSRIGNDGINSGQPVGGLFGGIFNPISLTPPPPSICDGVIDLSIGCIIPGVGP